MLQQMEALFLLQMIFLLLIFITGWPQVDYNKDFLIKEYMYIRLEKLPKKRDYATVASFSISSETQTQIMINMIYDMYNFCTLWLELCFDIVLDYVMVTWFHN